MKAEQLIEIVRWVDNKFPGIEFVFPVQGEVVSSSVITQCALAKNEHIDFLYCLLLPGGDVDDHTELPGLHMNKPKPMAYKIPPGEFNL